jgi:hypothetical protein
MCCLENNAVHEILKSGTGVKPYVKRSNKELAKNWLEAFDEDVEVIDDTPENVERKNLDRRDVVSAIIKHDLNTEFLDITVANILENGINIVPYCRWSSDDLKQKWDELFGEEIEID